MPPQDNRAPHALQAFQLDPHRQKPIAIKWDGDGAVGRITIDGELWAAVEWSEKHQRWCIEDAEGRCLSHKDHIHGGDVDKEAAVAQAEAMIRDGRMPDPETARQNRKTRLEQNRVKRSQQPAEQKREAERAKLARQWSEASSREWEAESKEKQEAPLYEVLADTFDFADPELWKSNSFAALRPRLVTHVRYVIAKLESNIACTAERASKKPFSGRFASKEKRQSHRAARVRWCDEEGRKLQQRLDRAREILKLLDPIADSEP